MSMLRRIEPRSRVEPTENARACTGAEMPGESAAQRSVNAAAEKRARSISGRGLQSYYVTDHPAACLWREPWGCSEGQGFSI